MRTSSAWSEAGRTCKIVFINWPAGDSGVRTCDLLDGTDFSDCKIVFFDPLGFAVSHKLRERGEDIAVAKYIPCSEDAFLRYLAGIKAVSGHIRTMLNDGGILVIRSQIPNSQFTIRKKSSVGARTYTESVVSPFFWLEEFLGRYNFNYCNLKTVKYRVRNHPLRRTFSQCPVSILQTQNSIGERQVEVIAAAGLAFKLPAISKVTFSTGPGQIYLIPQFDIEWEHVHLIDAFERIALGRASGPGSPKWLADYEAELERLSPYKSELERLDREISAMENRKLETLEKHESTTRLADLLTEDEADLELATRTAMELLGFECSPSFPDGGDLTFEALSQDDKVRRAIVKTAATDSNPIRLTEVEQLKHAIDSKTLKVKPKGILIGNPFRRKPPSERDVWFDPECLDEARHNDFCLMPSYELYTVASHILRRADSDHIEDIKASLRQEIFDCDSQFAINKRRYGM